MDLAASDRVVVGSGDDVEVQGIARYPYLAQGPVEGLCAEVQEELIGGPGVDPYAAQGPELFGVAGGSSRRTGSHPSHCRQASSRSSPVVVSTGRDGVSFGAGREAC